MRTRVKICCVSSIAEAQMAVQAGADALGLVSAMPSGPGVIDEELITRIAATVPPGVGTFLLTSQRNAPAIIRQIKVVQVIHVTGWKSIAQAINAAATADALLLDSGNPTLPVKQLGGAGRQHDWSISREIVLNAGKPVYLAGGLRAENVRSAIAGVGPFAVDVCSGVRTAGRLDAAKLHALLAATLENQPPRK
jgi:phosphoribosylanthranilate isomerase